MKRDIFVYIEDVLECVEKIETYTKNIGEKKFYEDTKLQDAVITKICLK